MNVVRGPSAKAIYSGLAGLALAAFTVNVTFSALYASSAQKDGALRAVGIVATSVFGLAVMALVIFATFRLFTSQIPTRRISKPTRVFLAGIYVAIAINFGVYLFTSAWTWISGQVASTSVLGVIGGICIALIVVCAWLVLASWISDTAKSKGRSWGAFFALTILTSPIIMGIVVAAISSNFQTVNRAATRKCPQCAESISIEARLCKHCGSSIEPTV